MSRYPVPNTLKIRVAEWLSQYSGLAGSFGEGFAGIRDRSMAVDHLQAGVYRIFVARPAHGPAGIHEKPLRIGDGSDFTNPAPALDFHRLVEELVFHPETTPPAAGGCRSPYFRKRS